MSGGAAAVASGADLEREVAALGVKIGLDIRRYFFLALALFLTRAFLIFLRWAGV